MTWRSTLKAKARELVPRFYPLGENFKQADNMNQAQELICGSAFTFGPDDPDVRADLQLFKC